MLNKKSQSREIGIIIVLVISLTFGLFWFLGLFSPAAHEAKTTFNRIHVQNRLDQCKTFSGKGGIYEHEYDNDKDGLKDTCDNCPTIPNKYDARNDPDNDLFPTGCCGNDGNLEYYTYEPGRGKEPRPLHTAWSLKKESLPCIRGHPGTEELGKRAKPPDGIKYQPVYTWGGGRLIR